MCDFRRLFDSTGAKDCKKKTFRAFYIGFYIKIYYNQEKAIKIY